jgi:cyclase
MSLALRVIPCLDVNAGKVVKGIKFQDLQTVGDPVELAGQYFEAGADEITFLDVTASVEDRSTILDVVSRTADSVFIPLTVGGGVRTIQDVQMLLSAGADKVSVGTAAISSPNLLDEIGNRYGDQVLVVSLDIKRNSVTKSGYTITTHGGSKETGIDALRWIEENQHRGIGELLLNSMDSDGTKTGFDLELIRAIRNVSNLPLIASGGAGTVEHFAEAERAGASAVLAASVFHNGELSILEVKKYLESQNIEVRL